MRSCISLLYICAFASLAIAQTADALYADRTNLASAKKAAEMWAAALAANPTDFETAWKLSRADYWLGGHTGESEQRRFYENGIEAGQKAIALQPNKPDGHFWVAANMGMLAESFGLRAGLKYRKPIRDELETLLRLDPAFREGSADRALGRWYFKVPALFGGSHKQAEAHLKASLKYNPNSTISHYFLAELYVDEGRKAETRAELQTVLDASINPDLAPEDQEWKDKARALLATIR
jgi:tetratricopeptide (TPR) repeat protein